MNTVRPKLPYKLPSDSGVTVAAPGKIHRIWCTVIHPVLEGLPADHPPQTPFTRVALGFLNLTRLHRCLIPGSASFAFSCKKTAVRFISQEEAKIAEDSCNGKDKGRGFDIAVASGLFSGSSTIVFLLSSCQSISATTLYETGSMNLWYCCEQSSVRTSCRSL